MMRFLAAVAVAGGLLWLGACGDGKNECERKRQKLRDCVIGSSVGCGEESKICSDEPLACAGQDLCVAECFADVDCVVILDAFSGMPTATSKPFLDCTIACASVP